MRFRWDQRLGRLVVAMAVAALGMAAEAFGAEQEGSADATRRPKLVVMITVDQLRGDMPLRFADRFGEGGFRYLLEQGLHYTDAHFQHSVTFTASGHATLATGGNPAEHGLAGNDWSDAATGERIYCVQDGRHRLLEHETGPHTGTSPRNLTSSTLGDELMVATGGRSRVYSVSVKDRGAILPGGHLGKAFWYSAATGRFVTSDYYFDDYPQAVRQFNEAGHADRWRDRTWDLLQPRDQYVYGAMDDRTAERPQPGMGATFPHAVSTEEHADRYYRNLRFTPMADELLADFARRLIESEDLGHGAATDLLAVSFSATDYIGHAYGPNSLEAEDNLLHLDRTLARFFGFLDEHVGLDNTLIVLSADHGVDDAPEFHAQLRRPPRGSGIAWMAERAAGAAPDLTGYSQRHSHDHDHGEAGDDPFGDACGTGRHLPERMVELLNDALRDRLGIDKDLVQTFWNPSLYLDRQKVEALGLELAAVEAALAEETQKLPGVALAVSRSDLLAGRAPQSALGRRLARSFHPQRSGHVLLVQEAFWYLYPAPEAFAAMHGSPHRYDTYVPILFAGPGVEPAVVDRAVAPEGIAATLARYLNVQPPSGSTGAVLHEVSPPRD